MSNTLITVDALDFDGIKSNIKTFLSGQDVLSDWEYEGSVIQTLIDVLAYNTHYNALYTNLMLNESFIDSASKYSSVVSLAKSIGYVAKSSRSSRAQILLTISDVGDAPAVLTLPNKTKFKGQLNGRDYYFYSQGAITAPRTASGTYQFTIDIIEGIPSTNAYTVNPESGTNSFVIQNAAVDLQTLQVSVQENSSNQTFVTFNRVEDLLNVRGSDNVYFVKQREDLLYEIYFGNDVIGKSLVPGNVVYIDYMVSSGSITNGSSRFYYAGGFRGDASYQVSTILNAIGGANREQLEQIRFNAPRAYVAQNRAVTADDYKTAILSNFPQIQNISVWGGEDNMPPKFGVVFISAKPISRYALNSQEKSDIASFLKKNKQVVTIQHEFVDPAIIEILIDTTVYYNPTKTTVNSGDISYAVNNAIMNYANNIGDFQKQFRFSALTRAIDQQDKSIISNISKIKLQKSVLPTFGVQSTYDIVFGNPIYAIDDQVISTRFYSTLSMFPCYLSSTQNGDLRLYEILANNSTRFIKTIGSVDFMSGTINISGLIISGLYESNLIFTVIPASNDVIPIRNHILEIPSASINVEIIADTGNQKHIFAFSR